MLVQLLVDFMQYYPEGNHAEPHQITGTGLYDTSWIPHLVQLLLVVLHKPLVQVWIQEVSLHQHSQ